MGVTISWRLAQEKQYIKRMLDRAEEFAKTIKRGQADQIQVPFKINRHSDTELYIDIGECETLAFDFNPRSKYMKSGQSGWNYENETLKAFQSFDTDENDSHYQRYPEQILYWDSSFCKTQFAKTVAEHRWVADLIRCVASRCKIAVVNDEGDYYYSGDIEDAEKAIGENGKLIDSIGGMLAGKGFSPDQIIKGGETVVKPRRNKKSK